MKKIYFENLDRWRFLAALAVISSHYVTVFDESDPALNQFLRIILTMDGSGAEVGVSFFFVLSGFLITWLLLQEKTDTGRLAIGKFYMRRILRIWPLYFLSVAIGFVLVPAVLGSTYQEIANWKWYALFLANWDQILHWKNQFPNPLLGVHWSVAVEEQFYLIWPWLLFFNTRRFPLFAGLIAIVSITFEWKYSFPTHTISCLHDLAIGGITGYLCFWNKERIVRILNRIRVQEIILVYLIGTLLVISKFQLSVHVPVSTYILRTFHALFFAFIIVDQSFNTRDILKWLPWWFLYLGKISYGLYLLHPIALFMAYTFLPDPWRTFWLQFPLVIIFSIVLSTLSYHFFEMHFLKLKKNFNDP
jgi:peptidoglycan/LPS O-acetylase OafA/YrhL